MKKSKFILASIVSVGLLVFLAWFIYAGTH